MDGSEIWYTAHLCPTSQAEKPSGFVQHLCFRPDQVEERVFYLSKREKKLKLKMICPPFGLVTDENRCEKH